MITVWMPVYNEQDSLAMAIESVISQTYTEFRFVISNNHSADNSGDIINHYANLDSRIIHTSPPSFLSGIEHGKFINSEILNKLESSYSIFIGGHDIWESNLIECLLDRAKTTENFSIIYTDSSEIDENSKVVRRWDGIVHSTQIAKPFIPHHILLGLTHNIVWGGLWNDSVRRQIGSPKYSCCAADHLMVAEAALLGDIIYKPGSHVYLRQPKCINDGVKAYAKKHVPDSLLNESHLDFICQLDWVSSISDKAISGHPFNNHPAIKDSIKNSLLSAYIFRYLSLFDGFDNAFDNFFSDNNVQSILRNNMINIDSFSGLINNKIHSVGSVEKI